MTFPGARAVLWHDIDGEGRDELVLGYPDADAGGGRTGIVEVYAGTAGGVAAAPMARLRAVSTGSAFGNELAAGDVNGDGFGDLVISEGRDEYAFAGGVAGFAAPVHLPNTPFPSPPTRRSVAASPWRTSTPTASTTWSSGRASSTAEPLPAPCPHPPSGDRRPSRPTSRSTSDTLVVVATQWSVGDDVGPLRLAVHLGDPAGPASAPTRLLAQPTDLVASDLIALGDADGDLDGDGGTSTSGVGPASASTSPSVSIRTDTSPVGASSRASSQSVM